MIWTGERSWQQGALVAELYGAAAGVPCERSGIIAGGLPGADKAGRLAGAGVDKAQFFTVSIDAILVAMAARQLIPVSGGSPLNCAGAVHGEAQFLAKRLALLALVDGRNLILDISLVSWRAAEAWTYALRFANYTVTAVLADIDVEEAVRHAQDAHHRGEEDFRRGQGYGGRYLRAEAIRAMAGPAAAAPRSRIRWALGAQSADAIGGTISIGTFPGSSVSKALAAYRDGQLSLEVLLMEFRLRRWPQVPDGCSPELEQARPAIDDPEPYVPG